MSKTSKTSVDNLLFGLLYTVLVAVDIFVASTSYVFFRVISKPLILITLIVYFLQYKSRMERRPAQSTLLALLCSLIGDCFLLFDRTSELYFILGLGSFLVAHICYAYCFYLQRSTKNRLDVWLMAFLLACYGIALYLLLYPRLGRVSIPVATYILTILIMVIMAYKRKINVSSSSFLMVFIGAFFFVISDSLLAIHKFLITLPFSNFLVMSTYAAAQFLIIKGLLTIKNGHSN